MFNIGEPVEAGPAQSRTSTNIVRRRDHNSAEQPSDAARPQTPAFFLRPAVFTVADKPIHQGTGGASDKLPSPGGMVTLISQASSKPSYNADPTRQSEAQLPPTELDLYTQLMAVVAGPETFHLLLNRRPEDLRCVLDFLQYLLSLSKLGESVRRQTLTVLLRLSTSSGLYPRSFDLRGDQPTSSKMVTTAPSSYGDIETGFIGNGKVCLKILRAPLEKSQGLKSFIREIVILGQLRHPSILPFFGVHDLGINRRKICLVSPWMENGNLNDYLLASPEVDRLLLMRDILSGLKYIHSMMIAHGDLKSANILITHCGRACLGDFGLASISGTELSRYPSLETTGHQGASYRFEAPELILHITTDKIHRTTASDIYAIGCVFYEVFTGKLPFYEAPTPAAVILRLGEGGKPTKPVGAALDHCIARGMTDLVWSIIESCWSSDADRRPTASRLLSMAFFTGLEDNRAEESLQCAPERCAFDYSNEPDSA
ncbi:hypothetical protein D9756_006148 [Leucocoprinus leucothites]|uniref:Protein kinase domain-containing protein n=1 Tax=Leucocoprinus leucothites TaxID=201217 RepID=A0A8H5FXB0_9AGAR|nr:hypothetical protein D9756_006148 [Leucoagaricus leucothites]